MAYHCLGFAPFIFYALDAQQKGGDSYVVPPEFLHHFTYFFEPRVLITAGLAVSS